MKSVHIIIFCVFLTFATSCNSAAEEVRIKLFSHMRRSGVTNEWWLPMSRLKALPKWNPEKEELPLSLEKALQTARKWACAMQETTGIWLQSVTILSIQPNQEEFRYVFYYRFIFGVDPFDRMACIVMMDGTVLEPEVDVPHKRRVRNPARLLTGAEVGQALHSQARSGPGHPRLQHSPVPTSRFSLLSAARLELVRGLVIPSPDLLPFASPVNELRRETRQDWLPGGTPS
jgi:hypothetical protein